MKKIEKNMRRPKFSKNTPQTGPKSAFAAFPAFQKPQSELL
jgi:hypothetical protein